MAKPEDPGKSEDAPGHNKDEEGKPTHPHENEPTQLPEEPEVEPLTSPTSNDVGEQTKTHADMAEAEPE
jgi:hypothetical protein